MLDNLKNDFYNPKAEFSPIPFWFWNDNLIETELKRQIIDFKSKGLEGFVIHPRIGIPKEIEYLSDRFMALVKFAVKVAAEHNMKVVLYDEAMYPSGSAHGLVVKDNPEYASRGLKMIEYACECEVDIKPEVNSGEKVISVLAVKKTETGAIDPEYTIKLEMADGQIRFNSPCESDWKVLVFVECFSRGTIRGIHFGEDDGEPEAPPSADLLNAKAVGKFIELTHERYYSELKEYFGNTIIGMFTDEPGILGRCYEPGLLPWTEGFLEWYIEHGNTEMDLPILWLDAGKSTGDIRRKYRQSVNRKLEETYYKPLSRWCEEHSIALTGHPEKSDEIGFLKYFHIPGQDIVWRWVAPENEKGLVGEHSTMGKCSSDAARHAGRRRNSNECFGCCGPNGVHWAFSANDMKWYLDWMFVRGVNLIYPHAFYYSVEGERRYGERPPDIGPNNIWWKYYKNISDYIKRMCWLMTDSVNQAKVAVLCEEDHLPWAIVKPLYQHQIEFNYLEESVLISNDCNIKDGKIHIAAQVYSVVLIDDIGILSQSALKKLQHFITTGGKVVVYTPEDLDKKLLPGVTTIKEYSDVINEAKSLSNGGIALTSYCKDLRLSHVIKDEIHFYLLVNEGEELIQSQLLVGTYGAVEKWNPWEGLIEALSVMSPSKGKISIPFQLERRSSIVICVDPTREPSLIQNPMREYNLKEIEVLTEWKIKGLMGKSEFNTNTLETWQNWTGMHNYSGTVEYEGAFVFNDTGELVKVEIDLGEVHELAHLYINGIDAGVRLWGPYVFDITKMLKKGSNIIMVEVTNSMANRLDGANLKSGLIGPVILKILSL